MPPQDQRLRSDRNNAQRFERRTPKGIESHGFKNSSRIYHTNGDGVGDHAGAAAAYVGLRRPSHPSASTRKRTNSTPALLLEQSHVTGRVALGTVPLASAVDDDDEDITDDDDDHDYPHSPQDEDEVAGVIGSIRSYQPFQVCSLLSNIIHCCGTTRQHSAAAAAGGH